MSKQQPPAPTIIQIVVRAGTGSLPRTIAAPDHPRKRDMKHLFNTLII